MSSVTNQIAYLTGGERPTAACMNALFAALDRKLGLMLSGKSPVIAQSANFPAYLLGKTFFFTKGQGTAYSSQVPGSIFISGGATSLTGTDPTTGLPNSPGYQIWVPPVIRDYQHHQFSDAVSALDSTTVTWDEANKIASIPRFPQSAYKNLTDYPTDPGLPWTDPDSGSAAVQVGFLENSLQCHYLLHQGASDAAAVPYYLQESGAKMPEKRYDWAVAELILEGATAVTIPAAWDKYKFFRIHNLNPAAATVTFQMEATAKLAPFVVTVPGFGCQTVRRTSVSGGYATNGNYFWWALAGDPRFYWFQPCGYGLPNQTSNRFTWSWDGRVADTMTQNNLTNPVILLDWIEYFTRAVDDFPGVNNYWPTASIHAGFIQDLSRFHSEYSHYTKLYGDPGKPATCLGDLIHHKGTVYAVQASKTQTDALSGKPFLTVITGTFNGYTTFVADMAALGVTARVNANGDYQLTNANPTQYDVTLVPVGTNFLKQGEHVPDHVVLSGATVYTIENAVLEVDPTNSESTAGSGGSPLSDTANQMVFPPTFTNAANTRQWIDPYTMSAPVTVIGPNIPTLNTSSRTASPTALHGIHAVTVADLLSLKFWGDPAFNPQSSAHFDLTNAQLQLTPQGLVLTWSEQYSGGTPAQYSNPWTNFCLGYLTLVYHKRVRFRHHGFGYVSDAYGSQSTGYLSCRQPLYLDGGHNFENDLVNAQTPGADFTFGKTHCTQSGVKVQQRVSKQQGSVFNWGTGRFWQCKQPGNYLPQYLAAVEGITWNAVSKTTHADGSLTVVTDTAGTIELPAGWTDARVNTSWINGGILITAAVSSFPVICFPLLPEMYNLMAQGINQITSGVPINYRALKFIYNGQVFAFDPQFTANIAQPGGAGHIGGNQFTYFLGPLPMDCWAPFDAGSTFDQFCAAQGITVRTEADLPQRDLVNWRTTPAVLVETVQVSVSGCDLQWGEGATTATATAPDGSTVISVDGPNAYWTAQLNVQGNTELLSSRSLRQGLPTGACCVGTFDPNAGNPVFPSGSQAWNYLVASVDMTAATAAAWGLAAPTIFKGDLATGGPFAGLQSYGGGSLYSVFGGSRPGDASDPTGTVWNLTTSYQHLRWLKLADAERFLLQFGFTFNFEEVVIPLTLAYLEDAFKLSNTNCCKELAAIEHHHTCGRLDQVPGFNAYVNSRTAQNGRVVTVGGAASSGCYQPYGTWLGWFVDARPDSMLAGRLQAQWKLRYNANSFYAPLPITNLSCRNQQSPLLRVAQYNAAMGMDLKYESSVYYNPPAGAPYWLGFIFPTTVSDPLDTDPNLGCDFGWGGCAQISAGQQPTQANVAFIVSQFVPSGPDTFTPFAAMGRQPLRAFQSYEEFSILDHYDAYLVHTYGAPRLFNIRLAGQTSWLRPADAWASPDAAFAIDGDGSTIAASSLYIPFVGYGGGIGMTALAAPADTLVGPSMASSTPNGGDETFTVLEGAAQTRYTACFDLARLAIDLTGGSNLDLAPTLASSSQPASSSQQI